MSNTTTVNNHDTKKHICWYRDINQTHAIIVNNSATTKFWLKNHNEKNIHNLSNPKKERHKINKSNFDSLMNLTIMC